MEPVYMILGQSAATAAVLAIEDNVSVQDIDRKKLADRLSDDAQVLDSLSTRLKPCLHWLLVISIFCFYHLVL
jgi:hypothetical protein